MAITEEINFPSDTDTPSTAPQEVDPNPIIFDPSFSLSPSASFTTFSPPASYKVTDKPTFLRTQKYCSNHHKRPRRCINRGCLFDNSTLQCTSGVPTATPSVSPSAFSSESPSDFLTISPQPTNKPYRVRLYWEQGYNWQGDSTEKFFCWACAQCSECSEEIRDRTGDCVDLLCHARHKCAVGMSIAVTDCNPEQSNDMSAEFSFLPEHRGLFDNYLKGGQIQVHNTDLCLSLVGVRSIELQTCDASKIEQRFQGFHPDEGMMELFPVNSNMKEGKEKEVKQCITQHHHPRPGERIFAEKCSKARRSDTSLWDLWTAY